MDSLYTPLVFSSGSRSTPFIDDNQVFWLAFGSSEECWHGGNFLYRILKRGFWHVFILMRDDKGWWVIDPTRSGLEIKRLWYPSNIAVEKIYKRENMRLISIKKCKNKSKSYKLISCMYCVTVVKYILGLKVKGITPYGLYKRLIKLSRDPLNEIKVVL